MTVAERVVDSIVVARPDGVTTTSGRFRRRRRALGERRRRRVGLLFVSPWLIGLCVFYLSPLVVSLAFSFTNYELVDQDDVGTKFIGLANWRRLLDDPQVRHSALVQRVWCNSRPSWMSEVSVVDAMK